MRNCGFLKTFFENYFYRERGDGYKLSFVKTLIADEGEATWESVRLGGCFYRGNGGGIGRLMYDLFICPADIRRTRFFP